MIGDSKHLEHLCKDYKNIENYEIALSSNERYIVHHKLETHNSDGAKRLVDLTQKELQALDMYYDRPSFELIFMSDTEHSLIHNYAKRFPHGHPIQREKMKSYKWFNNGTIEVMKATCPEGFIAGRIGWKGRVKTR